ncbi:hypothetical protein E3N88_28258 [Mikania micrantha]|uniref:Uncharacterized protein n=1 Tax=Mikania micrantha TaxID=192012 RepID=A0A5N6N061_9ASTR|nr:hypothetical protein E3N88_28258 [Mikania micrantha]
MKILACGFCLAKKREVWLMLFKRMKMSGEGDDWRMRLPTVHGRMGVGDDESFVWVQEWLDFVEYCSRYGGLKVVDGRVFSKPDFRFKREKEDEKMRKMISFKSLFQNFKLTDMFV